MARKLCLSLLDIDSPIRLYQTDRDNFAVEYGSQVKEGLNYHQAAKELGYCVLHALACVGKTDWQD